MKTLIYFLLLTIPPVLIQDYTGMTKDEVETSVKLQGYEYASHHDDELFIYADSISGAFLKFYSDTCLKYSVFLRDGEVEEYYGMRGAKHYKNGYYYSKADDVMLYRHKHEGPMDEVTIMSRGYARKVRD